MNYAPQSEQTKAQHIAEKQARLDRSLQLNRPLFNKILLEGFIAGREQRRMTAAGLPVVKIQLVHFSEQPIAGAGLNGHISGRNAGQSAGKNQSQEQHCRQVSCTVSVLFIGEPICKKIDAIADDSLVKVSGFLTRNAYKDELSWIIVEALNVELISIPGSAEGSGSSDK